MGILQKARAHFVDVVREHNVPLSSRITVRPLQPTEAIGSQADGSFAIRKGKERVIEARFMGARGQAFTDRPSAWEGTLDEALALDLSSVPQRAVFVAALNAVMRAQGLASGTVHCRDEGPSRCGPEMAQQMEGRFGRKRVGLIGLQPAILGALVARLGPEAVRVLDLDADNIGSSKCGVEVWNGETDLPHLVGWCEVVLATGSSIVNGTIDEIAERSETAGKPLVFFGNTISGAAVLLDLDRICPFGE